MARLTLRIDFDDSRAVGPGKIRLLEAIGETGSISAAGRTMGMSYRRAWMLVDDLNRMFRQPVVEARGGGGAHLTPFGTSLVTEYRMMADEARVALSQRLPRLEGVLAPELMQEVG